MVVVVGLDKPKKDHRPKAELIRELAMQGLTGKQIGQKLGMSRNAVYGLAWRHGITLSKINPILAERIKREKTKTKIRFRKFSSQ